MVTRNFMRLRDALRSVETDPATVDDPIKRMFLCDGEFTSANIAVIEDTGDAVHIHSSHEEFVLILEGDCWFRVGDETKRVTAGDLIFIPRDAVHGPIIDSGRIALLSIFAPFFDRAKKNIRWSRDDFS